MTIYHNASAFKAALQRFGRQVDESYESLIRSILIALIYKVANATPVDTGRAAGSWSISRHQPGGFMIPEGSHSSAQEAIARAMAVSFKNPYVTWYIYNNVPYIEQLEYEGRSAQAPHGMLRISVAEMEGVIGGFLKRVLSE